MITFKLLDDTTSKDTIVQINPSHIILTHHDVCTDYIEELGCECYVSYATYKLIAGMQVKVCIVEPMEDYDREEFIHFLDRSVSFKVTYLKWS